ncbi:MAG: hypothetical protein V1784_04255, partial [bacterium]
MCKLFLLFVLMLAMSTAVWAEGGETCADATLIEAFTYYDTGSTVGHIRDYPPDPVCVSFSGPDVVYKFIAPEDVSITVSLCGSDYNTVLDCWKSLLPGGPACPDEPGADNTCCDDNSCDLQSCCQFYLLGGCEAYMIVTGAGGSAGDYIFDFYARPGHDVYVPCPPNVNDDCFNTLEVTIDEAIYGTTRHALWDLFRDDAPYCITPITAPGVWYMVTGTGNILTATTCNVFTGYDTKLNVYSGSCDALVCVTGNDNDP